MHHFDTPTPPTITVDFKGGGIDAQETAETTVELTGRRNHPPTGAALNVKAGSTDVDAHGSFSTSCVSTGSGDLSVMHLTGAPAGCVQAPVTRPSTRRRPMWTCRPALVTSTLEWPWVRRPGST